MSERVIGIDAFNISSGGGLTHLREILKVIQDDDSRVKHIVVWGSKNLLAALDERTFLHKVHISTLDRGLFMRLLWHIFRSKKVAKQAGCDVLYLPGGTDLSGFTPSVTMSRNMLPFEILEIARYKSVLKRLKYHLLRAAWKISFRQTDGLIFLTKYAKEVISKVSIKLPKNVAVIPHGVDSAVFSPDEEREDVIFSFDRPCRIVYVSIVNPYKHHRNVVHAVSRLRERGYPVILDLIGPPGESFNSLMTAIRAVDPQNEFISYTGFLAHNSLQSRYKSADIGVFASTCENMPNILLEMMASGLPIASSNFGPMPEVIGGIGEFFNPLNVGEIHDSLEELINNSEKRLMFGNINTQKAAEFTWRKCADETLDFLLDIKSNCN
ncbi:glycosyltransferase family 4 protein [Paracoccaceae bacterium]|nr:glycosyltransferase family 4 protein [Paracoccaceae bacterium]